MTSPKRTKVRVAPAGRMKALTESWKKAFDARIRTATLTRRRPAKTPTGTGAKRP